MSSAGNATFIAPSHRHGTLDPIAHDIKEMRVLVTRGHEAVAERSGRHLRAVLARTGDEVEAAQRLRYRVFTEEMGARITGARAGIDCDFFDPWCEHLLVRDETTGEVAGTYRILAAEHARRLGTFYADTEFDLTRLALLRSRLCEVGRACIHPDYHTGAVIMLLWHGIAAFMQERGHEYLIGCASVSMADGGIGATRIWQQLAPAQVAPIEYRVFPRHPLVPAARARADEAAAAAMPPLLKGYLRLGAWIGGEPAWDPDFNTADLFVFLPLARVAARYARHYLRAA